MKMHVPNVTASLQLSVAILLLLFAFMQPLSIAGAEIAYCAAVFAWIVYLICARPRSLRASLLDVPILVFLTLSAISSLMSPLPGSSWEGMRKVSFVLLVLLVAHNVFTRRRVKQLIAVICFSGLLSVGWAAWEDLRGVGLRLENPDPNGSLYRAGLRNNDVLLRVDGQLIRDPALLLAHLHAKPRGQAVSVRVVHNAGVDTNLVMKNANAVVIPGEPSGNTSPMDKLDARIEVARPIRAVGFYSHYMSFAYVLVMLSSIAFGLWLGCTRPLSLPGLLFGSVFLALAFGLELTLTRSAWLALGLGCACQLWLHLSRYRKSLFVLLPFLLLGVFAATNVAMHRLRGKGVIDFSDPGTDYRVLMWRDGLRIIRERPWFGVGMNTVRDAWWHFNLAAYNKYGLRLHFHSNPIQIAVETGLPALLAWLVLMGCCCVLAIRVAARARERNDRFYYGLGLGILGAMVAFLAGGLVQYDFGDSLVVLLFWFLAGLALAIQFQMDPASA